MCSGRGDAPFNCSLPSEIYLVAVQEQYNKLNSSTNHCYLHFFDVVAAAVVVVTLDQLQICVSFFPPQVSPTQLLPSLSD